MEQPVPLFFRLRLLPDSGKFELLIGHTEETANCHEVNAIEIRSWLCSLHSFKRLTNQGRLPWELHIGDFRMQLNNVARARLREYIELVLDGSEEYYRTR